MGQVNKMTFFYNQGDDVNMDNSNTVVMEYASDSDVKRIAKNLIDNADLAKVCEVINILKSSVECTIPELYDFELYKLNEESMKAIEESMHPEKLKAYTDVNALLEELKA